MVDYTKNQSNIEFLAQNFSHMSAEGKMGLKNFLQNLVFLQGSVFKPGAGEEAPPLVSAAEKAEGNL
jgi:hypothetical protein